MRTKLTLGFTAGIMSLALTAAAQSADSNLSDGSILDSGLVPSGWSITDNSAAPPLTAVNRAAKSEYNRNSGDWLDLSASGQDSWSALSFGAPASAPVGAGSEYAMNPAMDNNSEGLFRQEDHVGSNSIHGRMPLMSSPEPGTISLLVMGGAAFASAIRRRKSA